MPRSFSHSQPIMPPTTYVASQPGPFAALLQAAELGGFRLDPMPPVRVHDVYLDTETGDLLARGATLRSRTLDGGASSLSLRPLDGRPAEAEAQADPADIAILPDGPLSDAVSEMTGGQALHPILRLRQYRTPRIAYDGARMVGLVSFDVVVYETDAGNVVANEVELEFSDPDRDVPRLDAVLQANGLEPAERTKLERGILRAHQDLGSPALLLPDERAALDALRAQGTAEERRRAQIVLLDARGYSANTIAEQTQTSPARTETVRRQFRAARMTAMRSGAALSPPSQRSSSRADPRSVADGFDDLDAMLASFQTPLDETPVLDGPPLAPLDPVPEFVPTVGWERSASLSVPPLDRPETRDGAPRFEPVGEALTRGGVGADLAEGGWEGREAEPYAPEDSVGAAPEGSLGAAPEGSVSAAADGGWVQAAVAPPDPAAAPSTASQSPPASWIEAAIAPADQTAAPRGATWSRPLDVDGPHPEPPGTDTVDPFADEAITESSHSRQVTGDTPILEAAWLTIGHQVAAFERATDSLFQSGSVRDARRLFLSAHRVRLALESFGPYLPDRAVERMTGALRRLVLTLDAAQDYDRAVAEGARHLEPVRDAHLESARRILEGGRQRAWGHRSKRLLGRLQAQGREGLLIGDDFPAPPDDFIGEVGDRPVPSRLRHVLGSLVWRRYEDILAFEDDIETAFTPDLAYHLATAVSGLHFVLGLAEHTTPDAARDLARVLNRAEALAAAYRHERQTAALRDGQGELRYAAEEVREVWRLLASAQFRERLARVAVGV